MLAAAGGQEGTRSPAVGWRDAKKKALGSIAIQGLLLVGTEPEQIAQEPKYSTGIQHGPVLGNCELTLLR